jgi:putative membrane protein
MRAVPVKEMRSAFAAAAILFGSAAALAQSTAPTPPAAGEFVTKVAISAMFEIQSSQLALDKQADRDIKPLAQKMVKDGASRRSWPCSIPIQKVATIRA